MGNTGPAEFPLDLSFIAERAIKSAADIGPDDVDGAPIGDAFSLASRSCLDFSSYKTFAYNRFYH